MRNLMKLGPEETSQTLKEAANARSEIVIEPESVEGATINGRIISCDKQVMLIEVTGRLPVPADKITGQRCGGFVYHDRKYTFASEIVDLPNWGETQAISIARPQWLGIPNRRRFLRSKLAPSSTVQLEWKDNGVSHRQSVNLLNISADGMACRVNDSVAGLIDRRHQLNVSFDLPDGERSISLSARVTNKTPASEGCSIIGLQFVTTERDAATIRDLRIAIEKSAAEEEAMIR